MKKTTYRIIMVLVILLAGVVIKMYTGESGGADVAQEIAENITNGGAITYTEKYSGEGAEGVYIYSRDADGNVMISDVGTDNVYGYEYDVVDYKIDDVYYANIEGVNYQYGTEEINQFEGYEGYDIAGFFTEEEDYVISVFKNYSVDLFDNEINAEFKREGDYYVATGEYEEGGDYRVELAKDGSSFKIEDEDVSVTVTFDTEPIVLP